MLRALSTHVFLRHRLNATLLEALRKGGAEAVEIFAARQHFDYTSREAVRELASWFASQPVAAHSVHGPLFADAEMGRGGAPAVNVVHPDKSRRIESMDEVKRAVEVAELLPFRFLVLHLGERTDLWSDRTLEHALTAVEHLKAFAKPLGVTLLLENIQNDVTEPEHLLEILRVGHFNDVGVCFDIGHAHLGLGVPATLETLKERIASTHLHDNHGDKDEHLWPGEGTIDWAPAIEQLQSAPMSPAALLEIHYSLGDSPASVSLRAAEAFRRIGVEETAGV